MGGRGGHPQGVPLRVDDEGARIRGEGTHKGCPYGMLAASGGFVAGGCSCPGRSVGQSHELNSDAKIVDEGRVYGGEGRAPTRGAPTGCWQPQEVLSLVDAVALGVL